MTVILLRHGRSTSNTAGILPVAPRASALTTRGGSRRPG
ncbi:hypothetical protein I547_7225 [Mycobacterium kansasii 824]|nr:hypothetical protein I547_7225 [Mycobacterium kansasii 824]